MLMLSSVIRLSVSIFSPPSDPPCPCAFAQRWEPTGVCPYKAWRGGSGDNGPAADIRCSRSGRCFPALPLTDADSGEGKQEADKIKKKALPSPRGLTSSSVFQLFSEVKRVWRCFVCYGGREEGGGSLNKKLSRSAERGCGFQHTMILSLFVFLFSFSLCVSLL